MLRGSVPTLTIGAVLLAAAALPEAEAARPRAPKNCRAVPDYGARAIVVEWDDDNREDGFRLFRATASEGPFERIGTDLPRDAALFIDGEVEPNRDYFYRIQAYNDDGDSDLSNTFRQNLNVVWPLPASVAVLHGWNDTIGAAGSQGLGFHKGCDLQQSGSTPNVVVAPRGGIVVRAGNQGFDNNHVYIEVRIGDERRYDSFNHLDGSNTGALDVDVGDHVRAGQPIGRVGDDLFTVGTVDFVDHTHYFTPSDPLTNEVDGRHPLAIFSEPGLRDPGDVRPRLHDHSEPSDGSVLFHANASPAGPPYLTLPLGDDPATGADEADVDVHVELADLDGGRGTTGVPTRIAWWIERDTCGESRPLVRSTDSPYALLRWDDRFFTDHGVNWRVLVDQAQDRAPSIEVDGVEYPQGWNNFRHFILTHGAGATGRPEDLDAELYWNTDARDDGSPVGVAHASFAGYPDATRAQEARFPDGDYRLHLRLEDLVGTRDDRTEPFAVDNFAPAVVDGCAVALTGSGLAQVAFSEPMNMASVEAAISLEPAELAERLTLEWEPGGCRARFETDTPVDGEALTIRLDGAVARDRFGRGLDGRFGQSHHDGSADGTSDSVELTLAFVALGEVQDLQIDRSSTDGALVRWNALDGATGYGVLRGRISELGPGILGDCQARGIAGTSLEDAALPPTGDGFFYLIQGEIAACHARGTLGTDSQGIDRAHADPPACS